MASCGWWKGDCGSMWEYFSINHNSSYGQVVAKVVPFDVAPEFFFWDLSPIFNKQGEKERKILQNKET